MLHRKSLFRRDVSAPNTVQQSSKIASTSERIRARNHGAKILAVSHRIGTGSRPNDCIGTSDAFCKKGVNNRGCREAPDRTLRETRKSPLPELRVAERALASHRGSGQEVRLGGAVVRVAAVARNTRDPELDVVNR